MQLSPAEALLPLIFPTEPRRYGRDRWASNNGFRSRWLACGATHAAAINAARRGDLDAVLAHAATLGGLAQRLTFARSTLRAAAKLAADVPAYRVVAATSGIGADGRPRPYRMVSIPNLTWVQRGRRQMAKIEWLPMWGVHTA